MFRTLLLLGTAAFTLPLCAQRVVPFGAGATSGVADMALWNGQLVVVGSNAMDLLGVDGNGVQGWDGTQVFSFPTVFTGSLGYRQVEELNGDLYIAGRISALGNMARWDGAAWVALDQGLPDQVSSLCVHDGALHAATMNGLVCRWTGAAWDTLGGRFDASIRALTSHQGVLYAGGFFTLNWEGDPVSHLARWTGSTWQQPGAGLDQSVDDLLSTPDGLVVGGNFTADGNGAPLPGWAVWNGSAYSCHHWTRCRPMFPPCSNAAWPCCRTAATWWMATGSAAMRPSTWTMRPAARPRSVGGGTWVTGSRRRIPDLHGPTVSPN
jgi:hypothetical protein